MGLFVVNAVALLLLLTPAAAWHAFRNPAYRRSAVEVVTGTSLWRLPGLRQRHPTHASVNAFGASLRVRGATSNSTAAELLALHVPFAASLAHVSSEMLVAPLHACTNTAPTHTLLRRPSTKMRDTCHSTTLLR